MAKDKKWFRQGHNGHNRHVTPQGAGHKKCKITSNLAT